MRLISLALFAAALAACGGKDNRLTGEQASAEHNAVIETPVAIEQSGKPPASTLATYNAIGTEPGWALTVRPTTMTYQGDYGSVKISEPTPANFRASPGRYAGTRLKLTISPGPCSDGMSDLVYRHTVRLVADGRPVTGCGGGTIAPDRLAGTSWTVTAINGRATPRGAGYFINFADREISAQFGCNRISGQWRLNGDHLSTRDLMQTEMGCPDPAMTFERLGSAVLNSNVRVERTSGERMRLVSEAGLIDLKRAI